MFWESSLFTVLQGDEDHKEHTLKPADSICYKRYPHNSSFSPGQTGRFQIFLTNPGAAKPQRTDSLLTWHNQIKHLMLSGPAWPKGENFLELKQDDTWLDRVPKIFNPGHLEYLHFIEVCLSSRLLTNWILIQIYSLWIYNIQTLLIRHFVPNSSFWANKTVIFFYFISALCFLETRVKFSFECAFAIFITLRYSLWMGSAWEIFPIPDLVIQMWTQYVSNLCIFPFDIGK